MEGIQALKLPCIFILRPHLANINQWESIWAVNMRGPVLCYKYAAIQMAKQNSGGRIIGKEPLPLYVLVQTPK